jgi:hypothetical protein
MSRPNDEVYILSVPNHMASIQKVKKYGAVMVVIVW